MNTATRTSLVVALAVIAACSSSGGPGTQPSDPAGALSVTPGVDTLFIGDSVRFATLRDSGPAALGDSGPVSWTVSDSRVAAIAQQGAWWALVRAIHQGTTTVTAAKGSSTASAVLVVSGTQLVFTRLPTTGTAGVTFTPAVAVTIEDALGRPITSATNAVTVALDSNADGAMLSGTTTVTAVNGLADFPDLLVQKAGSGYRLTASSRGSARSTSAPFAIIPAPPAQLVFSGLPNVTASARPITPGVQVAILDAFGNLVPSSTSVVSIAIGTNPSGGTLSGTTTVTAASGIATFADLGIDLAGSGYTFVATSPGLAGATSTAFEVAPFPLVASVTVTPAKSTALWWQSVQLAATLRDANGNVLTARPVTWTSSNPKVHVSSTGLVTSGPIYQGGVGATITATCEAKSGTATVAFFALK